MDNPEYTFQILEVFSKIKPREIPRELEEYINYVARTGDPVFQWSLVKVLIKEKLLSVLNEFTEGSPNIEIPPCPNVDPFNFEAMKDDLIARLDSFILPPFTIQRLCELLAAPRKEYNRLDKYMRAVEKNVLVVSASELSLRRGLDADNSDAVINGILYDKVNDSLNNISNHVFSGEENDGESSSNSKLDETDAVQQMIEESWNEENQNEYKINGAANSSLSGYDLDFVTDKKNDCKNISSESKGDESFDSNSMIMDSSLQNIINEGSNITFESVSKADDSYEFKDDSQDENFESKNNLTYELKDDSCDENNQSTLELKQLDQNVGSSIETAIESDFQNEGSEDKDKACEFLFLNSENSESLHRVHSNSDEFSMGMESNDGSSNIHKTVVSTPNQDIFTNVDIVESVNVELSVGNTTNEVEMPMESSTKIERESLSSGDNELVKDMENQEASSSSNTEPSVEPPKELEPIIDEE